VRHKATTQRKLGRGVVEVTGESLPLMEAYLLLVGFLGFNVF